MQPGGPLASLSALWQRARRKDGLNARVGQTPHSFVWGNDNVSFPGDCYVRYVDQLYRKNALLEGTFTVLGRPARLDNLRVPTLAIAFGDDNIVPVASAQPLIDRAGARDKQLLIARGGHVGAVVSRKASTTLWPAFSTFWAQRDQ